MVKSNSFCSRYKLKKKRDLLNLRSDSKKFSSKYFQYFYKNNGLDYSRLAISASKKNGNAVFRNKLKRFSREIFRNSTIKKKGIDILIVFHPKLKSEIYKLKKKNLELELKKAWNGELR